MIVLEIFSTGLRRLVKWLVISIVVLEGVYVIVMVDIGDINTVVVVIVVPLVVGF